MLTIEMLEQKLKTTREQLNFELEICWSEKARGELLKLKKDLDMEERKIADLKKYLGE